MPDAKDNPTEISTPEVTRRLRDCRKSRGGSGTTEVLSVPERYRHHTLLAFPDAWAVRACDFIEGYREHGSLLLTGQTGSRKTTFSAAVLGAWRFTWPEQEYPWMNGIFVPMHKAAEVFRDFSDTETLTEWRNTSMLVLDDVGAQRSTPHLMESLLLLLEYRYDWMTPTIVTTNLDLDELSKAIDPRAASRLQQGIVLDCGDKDWRRE